MFALGVWERVEHTFVGQVSMPEARVDTKVAVADDLELVMSLNKPNQGFRLSIIVGTQQTLPNLNFQFL